LATLGKTERVASPSAESQTRRNSFRVATKSFLTQGFKANPGLKLANAFSVIVTVRRIAIPSQLLQSCDEVNVPFFDPGFQSKPWAEVSQRFQRYFLELANAFSVVPPQPNLALRLLGALRPMPKTTRNLNGQTTAQLAGEHDNLSAMMTFMSDEIG